MYYEDRLNGGGFARVLIAGGGAAAGRRGERAPRARRAPARAASKRSIRAARRGLQDRIGASPELLDVLAPLVGMLLRERKAA